jgi:hypothetical protein
MLIRQPILIFLNIKNKLLFNRLLFRIQGNKPSNKTATADLSLQCMKAVD